MSIYDAPVAALGGGPADLHDYEAKAVLVVNVASKCGLTPQYTGLEALQAKYADQGFSVLGFPCNQFGAQEPGTPEAIQTFCSATYGVTFPMFDKVEVNGDGRHQLFTDLTAVADGEGHSGDVRWNFEKWLIAPGGEVTRFGPMITPEDENLVKAIEAALPG